MPGLRAAGEFRRIKCQMAPTKLSSVMSPSTRVTYLIQRFERRSQSMRSDHPPSGSTAQFDGMGENNVSMGLTSCFLTAGPIVLGLVHRPGSPAERASTHSQPQTRNRPGAIQAMRANRFTQQCNSTRTSFPTRIPNGQVRRFNDSFVILTA